MAALFKKNKKEEDKKKDLPKSDDVQIPEGAKEISGNWSAGGGQILKGFYVSEKASRLNGMNQYVFKVFKSANKPQVKSQVEKIFDVKVKDVKILNMPRKRRDMGRHPGFKTGFRKAVVVLKE